jgi:hypothetical protein
VIAAPAARLVAAIAAALALAWLAHAGYDAIAARVKAEQRAATAEAALARQAKALALADTLTTRLATAEADITHLTRERDDAIKLATTGRPCLRGAALRVLDGAPGLRVAAVPAPAASAAAADGAAAADPGDAGTAGDPGAGAGTADYQATDTAVARWILAAGAQYEVCRGRLDALIDYTLGMETTPATLDAR